MATKKIKDNHVVMGNNCFQCLNCGRTQDIPMPIDTGMFGAMAEEFDKQHKNCEKTWERPVNNINGKTEQQNADWWLSHGERGMSSETMFGRFTGRKLSRYETTPSDPDDFKRCYKLLQAVPQWKDKLDMMKSVSPVWSKLVDNWDKLTEMYERNVKEDWKNSEAIGMYEFMKSLGC